VKINAVTLFTLLALAGLSSQLSAEDRADVLARIAPIGQVSVEGQEQPVPAAEAAPAETPAAAEAAPQAATETVAVETAAAPAPAAGDGQLALATQSGCMACHKVDAKVVGPAYQDVAAKYKGDAAALEMLVEKVKKGGTGTWGPVPMPPNAHVSEENIRAIVGWVLSL
jgi:cytochrome c